MAFDAREYWEKRLGERWSLGGVGWLGLGDGFNGWAYRVRRRVFLNNVRPLLPTGPITVADIGSGTGFYIECWHQLKATRILGFDLTRVAVENLRDKFPDVPFSQLDVSAAQHDLPCDRFSAISIMDVLFHLTDDASYERAFENLSSLLEPRGLLIMSEFYVSIDTLPRAHIVYRPRGVIDKAAKKAGLELMQCRPFLVLMNDPVDTKNRLHFALWRLLVSLARRRRLFGSIIGAALFPIETVLVRFAHYAPSTKFLIYRKVA